MGDLNWFWLVEVMGFVHERGTQTPPPGSRQFVSFRFVFRARVFEVVGFACLLAWFFLFLFFTAATYHAGFLVRLEGVGVYMHAGMHVR